MIDKDTYHFLAEGHEKQNVDLGVVMYKDGIESIYQALFCDSTYLLTANLLFVNCSNILTMVSLVSSPLCSSSVLLGYQN